jgi:protein SCO1/2
MGRILLYAAGMLVAVAAGIVFYLDLNSGQAPSSPLSRVQATVITNPRSLDPFTLHDHKGEPFTLSSLQGKWTFLNFGYTYCPDVCPTTLATLARLNAGLEKNGVEAPYQVVFVSIDPERDTQKRLADYVPYFSPEFIGVRGEDGDLRKLTKQLGVLYVRVEEKENADGEYLMDHTASVMLIDPEGRFRAVFSAPHKASSMSDDFRIIASADKN